MGDLMGIVKFVEAMLRNLTTVKKAFYGVIALIVIADIFVPRHHPVFPWDHIPGFNALYGFIAAVVIILIAKVGLHGLMKSEDYYD